MFKGYNQGFNVSTPNISISEGLRPAQHYAVASYLPVARYDAVFQDYKVISHGKVVAIDSGNYLVPAGLIRDIETAIAETAFTNCVNVYTELDVSLGVKNSLGDLVTVGEPVVASFFTEGVVNGAVDNAKAVITGLVNKISAPIGLAPQDIWKQNGAGYGDGYSAGNPSDYTYTNYNLQQGSTVWTGGFIELPVVSGLSGLKLTGMVVFNDTVDLTKSLVTFDANSNFAMVGDTPAIKEVIGRILFVDDKWPKSFLEYVRVWEPGSTLGTPATPGSATKGLPDNLFLAGIVDPAEAKTVRINFQIR